MKCIGKRSDYVVVLLCIFSAGFLFLPFLFFVDEENIIAWVIFGMTLMTGLIIWMILVLIRFPQELIMYDEENKMIRIYTNKKQYRDIYLENIEKIKVDTIRGYRTYSGSWDKVTITLKNEEIIYVDYVSSENEVLDNLTTVK